MGSTTKVKRMVNKWFIAIKPRGDFWADISDMSMLMPPEGTYWADPFLIKRKGKTYLFIEDYDYNKGVISYMELDKTGMPIHAPRKILERPYHISFPFLVEDQGEVYMIPETGDNQRIELYHATKFPDEWELVGPMVEHIVAGDTIVYKNGKEFLMFTTESGDNNLIIMRSETLFDRWNIIFRRQIMNSRSAGSIFVDGDKIIRPTQDGRVYGESMYFKEIHLAPYTEKVIHNINPNWYKGLTGTHTFNMTEDFIVIDGRVEL